jgi:soluble lytic murein transglycosylase
LLTAGLLFVVGAAALWRGLKGPLLYKDIVDAEAARHGFDPLFGLALISVESRFNKSARSERGALGLMQIMPDTAQDMARRINAPADPARWGEPEINIKLGFHYLSLLKAEFKEDETALLAAYNAGPAKARSWRRGDTLDLNEIPYPETRGFVRKVQNTRTWLKNLQKVKHAVHL